MVIDNKLEKLSIKQKNYLLLLANVWSSSLEFILSIIYPPFFHLAQKKSKSRSSQQDWKQSKYNTQPLATYLDQDQDFFQNRNEGKKAKKIMVAFCFNCIYLFLDLGRKQKMRKKVRYILHISAYFISLKHNLCMYVYFFQFFLCFS